MSFMLRLKAKATAVEVGGGCVAFTQLFTNHYTFPLKLGGSFS